MNDQCLLGQACANEESSEAMNLLNSAQKANSKAYNKGYDQINWDKASPVIPELRWYGYRHVDGSIHVKRYLSEMDIKETRRSDFVVYTWGPFTAKDRPDALDRIQSMLRGTQAMMEGH